MSKMDGLRAMREARHAAMVARSTSAKTPASGAPVAPVAQKATTAAKAPARSKAAAEAPPAADDALCGHRNMSGRTCTREKGHAAKSHRYS